MNTVIIGLGSNIKAKSNIQKAKKILSQKYNFIAESKFIKTKPVGLKHQAPFINGAILITTELTQEQLKSSLKKIEAALGREYSQNKFAPRTIDLDIVIWNETVVDPDFYSREFLKNTVLQLLPNLKY